MRGTMHICLITISFFLFIYVALKIRLVFHSTNKDWELPLWLAAAAFGAGVQIGYTGLQAWSIGLAAADAKMTLMVAGVISGVSVFGCVSRWYGRRGRDRC